MHKQKTRWLLILPIILILFSCSEDKKVKLVSDQSILPQAEKEYNYSKDTIFQKMKYDSLQLQLIQTDTAIQFIPKDSSKLYNDDAILLPNQLGFKKKTTYFFNRKTAEFHYIKWTFKDSLQTINAFYNWLDCFGSNCQSIRINQATNGSKNAFLLYVTNTAIIYLNSNKTIQKKDWENSLLYKTPSKKVNYILIQPFIGKIEWLKSAIAEDSLSGTLKRTPKLNKN